MKIAKKSRRRTTKNEGALGIKGMFRVNITDKDGTLVGDSGWVDNLITQLGIEVILSRLISTTGYEPMNKISLGTGSSPSYTTDQLPGFINAANAFKTFSSGFTADVGNNKTNYCTLGLSATWPAGWNAQVWNISNVGLWDSDDNAGVFFAGKTYTSSACATDQQVTITYNILLGGQTGW